MRAAGEGREVDGNESGGREEEKKSEQVTYGERGNTITVQSSKQIGEYNFSFVSVSPTYSHFGRLAFRKKSMVDTPVLQRIKEIQALEMKSWKGLFVQYIARPGTLYFAHVP